MRSKKNLFDNTAYLDQKNCLKVKNLFKLKIKKFCRKNYELAISRDVKEFTFYMQISIHQFLELKV